MLSKAHNGDKVSLTTTTSLREPDVPALLLPGAPGRDSPTEFDFKSDAAFIVNRLESSGRLGARKI